MAITAKPVLKDKFWIIESDEERIGTMSWSDDRYMFSNKIETCFFDNKKQMKNRFGFDIIWDTEKDKIVSENTSAMEVHGFATSVVPYNALYDVKSKLPLFTKSQKSKSLYCAGYYIIRFDKGWVKSFCPKLLTVQRYEKRGPFKTEMEMRSELSRANR